MYRNQTWRRGFSTAAFFIGLAVLMHGCVTAPRDPVPADLIRTDVDPARRLAELGRMGPIDESDEPARYTAILIELLVSDDQPDALRVAAMDRLLAYDEPMLRDVLASHITVIDRWPVLDHIATTAVAQRWSNFVPALVSSYARQSQSVADVDRPERRAIEALRPELSLAEAIFEVFNASRDSVADSQRIAAWALLCRLEDPRGRLVRATSDALLVSALREAASVLDVLPATPQGCAMLLMAQSTETWQMYRETVPRDQGVALRHFMVFGPFIQPRDAKAIAASLEGERRVTRSERANLDGNGTESMAAQLDRLIDADVQMIAYIIAAMRQRSVVDAWFAQADADLADQSTEHGGVMLQEGDEGPPIARAYAPDQVAHDRQFVASPEMLMRLAEGGVHYHFHAQSFRNGDFAGPGLGDLAFVKRYEVNAIVLTFIDRDTLNVDYYQPNGVVVDLGCITR